MLDLSARANINGGLKACPAGAPIARSVRARAGRGFRTASKPLLPLFTDAIVIQYHRGDR